MSISIALEPTLIGSIVAGVLGTTVVSDVIVFPNFKSSLILFCIATFLMWVERLAVKATFESFNTDNATPIAIYGTQAGGIAIAHSISSVKEKQYSIRCFITDRNVCAGIYLLGKKVYLNGDNIAVYSSKKVLRSFLCLPSNLNSSATTWPWLTPSPR